MIKKLKGIIGKVTGSVEPTVTLPETTTVTQTPSSNRSSTDFYNRLLDEVLCLGDEELAKHIDVLKCSKYIYSLPAYDSKGKKVDNPLVDILRKYDNYSTRSDNSSSIPWLLPQGIIFANNKTFTLASEFLTKECLTTLLVNGNIPKEYTAGAYSRALISIEDKPFKSDPGLKGDVHTIASTLAISEPCTKTTAKVHPCLSYSINQWLLCWTMIPLSVPDKVEHTAGSYMSTTYGCDAYLRSLVSSIYAVAIVAPELVPCKLVELLNKHDVSSTAAGLSGKEVGLIVAWFNLLTKKQLLYIGAQAKTHIAKVTAATKGDFIWRG